jgi:hypothetical protein
MKKFLILFLIILTCAKDISYAVSYSPSQIIRMFRNIVVTPDGKGVNITNPHLTDKTLEIILGEKEIPTLGPSLPGINPLISLVHTETAREFLRRVHFIRENSDAVETLIINNSRNLRKLPKAIGTLQNLKKLDLQNNHLHSDDEFNWPTTITQLTYLKELDVRGNPSLTQFPIELETLPYLNRVSCDAENFSTLPDKWWPEEIKLIQETFIKNLRQGHIGLAHKNLEAADISQYREIFWDWFLKYQFHLNLLLTTGSSSGWTLLHYAIHTGDISIAKKILSNKFLNFQTALNSESIHDRKTPLDLAIDYQQYSFLSWLQQVEQNAKISSDQRLIINKALRNSPHDHPVIILINNNDINNISNPNVDASEIDLSYALLSMRPIIVSMKLLSRILPNEQPNLNRQPKLIQYYVTHNILRPDQVLPPAVAAQIYLNTWITRYQLFGIKMQDPNNYNNLLDSSLCLLLRNSAGKTPKNFGFREDKLTHEPICNFNQTAHAWATTLQRLQDRFNIPIPQEESALKVLDSGFKWNVYMAGHGIRVGGRHPEALIAGLPIETFKHFINYLESVDTNFLFYTTCYGGGINSLLAFKDAYRHRKFNFPIAIGSVTEDISIATPVDLDNFFKAITRGSTMWDILKNITSLDYLATNFPLVRDRGESSFKPLEIDIPSVKKVDNNTPLALESISYDLLTPQVILWNRDILNGTLKLNSPMPSIISTNPEDWVIHVINKVETPTITFTDLVNKFIPTIFGANKMFFIKEVQCLHPQHRNLVAYKNVLIYKTSNIPLSVSRLNIYLQYNENYYSYFNEIGSTNPDSDEYKQIEYNIWKNSIIAYIQPYAYYPPKSAPRASISSIRATGKILPAVLSAYIVFCLCTDIVKDQILRHLKDKSIDLLANTLGVDFIDEDNINDFIALLRRCGVIVPKPDPLVPALELLKQKLLELAQKLHAQRPPSGSFFCNPVTTRPIRN